MNFEYGLYGFFQVITLFLIIHQLYHIWDAWRLVPFLWRTYGLEVCVWFMAIVFVII